MIGSVKGMKVCNERLSFFIVTGAGKAVHCLFDCYFVESALG
jgi:hypothetical protein